MSEEKGAVRAGLIIGATVLVIAGLAACIVQNWHIAAIAAQAAFFCKWVECRLLERELVEAQLRLEASS